MNKTIMILVRYVGEYKYAKDIQDGKLRMETLNKYREIEESAKYLRKDLSEGVSKVFQPERSKIIVGDIIIPNKDIVKPITCTWNSDLDKKVYCMYALYYEDNEIKESDLLIDSKVKDFGEWAVVITDVGEFLKRLDKKISSLDISNSRGLVEYIDMDSYHGEWGIFKKDKIFSYQNEYRICLNIRSDGPYILDVGDISDISQICKTEEIFNIIEIRENK